MTQKLLHTFEIDLLEAINWSTDSNTGSIFGIMIEHGIYELGKTDPKRADRLREKDVRADAKIIPNFSATTNDPADYLLRIEYTGKLKRMPLFNHEMNVGKLMQTRIKELDQFATDPESPDNIDGCLEDYLVSLSRVAYVKAAGEKGEDPWRLAKPDVTYSICIDAWDTDKSNDTGRYSLSDSTIYITFWGNEE